MVADLFGPDIVVIVVWLVALVVTLVAIVHAASTPSAAFAAAGSSKALWLAVLIVFTLLTGVIGLVLAMVYLATIRPRVDAQRGR